MHNLLNNFFNTEDFMPHGHCYLWKADILWLNVGSDLIIALSYYVIPVFLVYLVYKRKDLAFNWIFIMFALFILACGTTHFMDIWTVWNPDYGLQGILKLFTAIISLVTAVMLFPLMPKALTLPNIHESEKNRLELQRLNKELQELNSSLEEKVASKTKDIMGFAAIVQYSNDAIIGKDISGNIISWNPGAEKLFGCSAEEAIGKSIYMLLPTDKYAEMDEILNRTRNGEVTEIIDTVRICKDGKHVDVSLTLSPLKDLRGNYIGSSSIACDITRRKQVDKILKQSEALKTAILNSSLEAIITIDHAGLIIEWNTMAENIFGYKRERVIGKDLPELIIPTKYRELHRLGLNHYLQTGQGHVIGKRIELSALKENGEEFPIEISVAAIDSEDKMPIFAASIRDITKRKIAELALKRNEARLRHVIEATPNGIIMVDKSGNINLINSQVEVLFGHKKEELIGKPIELLIPKRFKANHVNQRKSFFDTPESRQMGAGRDLYGLRNDGTEFPVEVGLSPLITDEGSFVLASVVDITKRKKMEDKIHRSTNAIQQKNKEMEQFVYTVSHDLKSPLVTSTGFLGLLKEDLIAKNYDNVFDSIKRLEKANDRMGQLINDLLQLSRVGKINIEIAKINMTNLIKLICDNLNSQISEKKVTVLVEDGMCEIQADQKRVYQVFENLIINALKYACDGPNPKIEIGSRQTVDEYQFFVKDYGPGIAPEYHEKIFGLFQRLDNDNKGTGVGLAIVSKIMQSHQGRVWVQSDVNEGAYFWVAFPKTVSIYNEE